MNSLSEIISNATDLATGMNPAIDLRPNAVALYALNVLADMELENSGSSRGRTAQKSRKSFQPDSRTGKFASRPQFIRIRTTGGSWETVDIVTDIEDLTESERVGHRAVFIYGDDLNYELSFEPDFDFEAEIWGTETVSDFAALGEAPGIPEEFAHLAATRIALVALDDLLWSETAPALMNFIRSRKQTLLDRLRDLTHRWTVYRSDADNSLADKQTRAYDPFDDFGDVFETF